MPKLINYFPLSFFLLMALLLSACASQNSAPNVDSESAEILDVAIKPTEKEIVFYQCEQGVGEVEMRFFPLHGVAVLVYEGVTHELQEQRAASGMWYSNGKYTFRGKGLEGWLEIGRRAPINCLGKPAK